MARQLIQKITPRFSECNARNNVHFASVYRYFEENRFYIAQYIGIIELLKELCPNEEFSFLVIRIESNYNREISRDNEIKIKTLLLPPVCAKIAFEHYLYANDELVVKTLVETAVVSSERILLAIDEKITRALDNYIQGNDLYI